MNTGFMAAVARKRAAPRPDILWWRLNEGTGTTISGDGINGGDDGTTDAAWVTGKSGSGSALDFSSQDAATDSSITYGASIITACGWVYLDSTSGLQILWESSADFNGSDATFIAFVNSGTVVCSIHSSASEYRIHTSTAPATGGWVHLAAVYDNSTTTGNVDIFYDAVDQAAPATTSNKGAAATFSAEKLYAGARASASLRYNGRLDDLRIYTGDQSAKLAAIMADAQ